MAFAGKDPYFSEIGDGRCKAALQPYDRFFKYVGEIHSESWPHSLVDVASAIALAQFFRATLEVLQRRSPLDRLRNQLFIVALSSVETG